MKPYRILLVEDEPNLLFNLDFNLKSEGYEVISASNGRSALDAYQTQGPFAVIILDVMLPEINGFELAKIIREKDRRTQILMLTARASESDVIEGLEQGADDYMTKPFSFKELMLRVKRMAARTELFQQAKETSSSATQIWFDKFMFDEETLELSGPKKKATLTSLEAKVLAEFLAHPQVILSRKHLLHSVWNVSENIETRTVDNFIMRIRKYIEDDPSKPKLLKSIRGRGYKLCVSINSDKAS